MIFLSLISDLNIDIINKDKKLITSHEKIISNMNRIMQLKEELNNYKNESQKKLNFSNNICLLDIIFEYDKSKNPKLFFSYNNFIHCLLTNKIHPQPFRLEPELFISITSFINSFNNIAKNTIEEFTSLAKETCNLYHNLSSKIFKIENEQLIIKNKTIYSFLEKRKLTFSEVVDNINHYKKYTFIKIDLKNKNSLLFASKNNALISNLEWNVDKQLQNRTNNIDDNNKYISNHLILVIDDFISQFLEPKYGNYTILVDKLYDYIIQQDILTNF